MDAIVTAGGMTRPDEPLYPLYGGGYKSMLEIHGKPMVQWVLDALNGSPRVDRIVVVGLPQGTPLASRLPLFTIEDHGGPVENIVASVAQLLRDSNPEERVLVLSADIPGITAEMVDWLVERVEESDHDLYYNVIRREVMEQRFPSSKRTYIRLKDGYFCGGDANAIRKEIATHAHPLFTKLVAARKNPARQAGLIGLGTLSLLMAGRLTIDEAVQRIGKRLEVHGRALECPYAEIGMDVDKPFQLDILKSHLEGRRAA